MTGQIPDSLQFKTTLDLCHYKNAEEFTEDQKGDSHLDHNRVEKV
jgi:hypothetical protein